RCQASIFACKLSRIASSSRFLGPRSRRIAASPDQNGSAEIPVLGVASFAMKSNKTGAIFNPWASLRFMMVISHANCAQSAVFRGKGQNGPMTGLVPGPFSPKARPMRRPVGAEVLTERIDGPKPLYGVFLRRNSLSRLYL